MHFKLSIAISLGVLIGINSYAQQVVDVVDFSQEYSAKVGISKTPEGILAKWLAIYDKRKGAELIKVTTMDAAIELTRGKYQPENTAARYDEGSIMIYQDFNFDGIKDFAIEDGKEGCYGGPSYKIFLASGEEFIENKEFSTLAHENCGLFLVDNQKKRLTTFSKSGAAWHESSEYIVEDNLPKIVRREIEDYTHSPYFINEITERKEGKMVKTTNVTLRDEEIDTVISFMLTNGKKLLLFHGATSLLEYALIRNANVVEFFFPTDIDRFDEVKKDFKYEVDKERRTITFSNKSATYCVYEYIHEKKAGIIISTKGKNYNYEASAGSIKGTLYKIYGLSANNVYIF